MASTRGKTAPSASSPGDPAELIDQAIHHLDDLDHFSTSAIGGIRELLVQARVALLHQQGKRAIIANSDVVGFMPMPTKASPDKPAQLRPSDLLAQAAHATDICDYQRAKLFLGIADLMLDYNIPSLARSV